MSKQIGPVATERFVRLNTHQSFSSSQSAFTASEDDGRASMIGRRPTPSSLLQSFLQRKQGEDDERFGEPRTSRVVRDSRDQPVKIKTLNGCVNIHGSPMKLQSRNAAELVEVIDITCRQRSACCYTGDQSAPCLERGKSQWGHHAKAGDHHIPGAFIRAKRQHALTALQTTHAKR